MFTVCWAGTASEQMEWCWVWDWGQISSQLSQGSTSKKLTLVCFRGGIPKFHWTHTTNQERWERTTGICHVARPTSPHSPIWREAVNGEAFPPPPSLGACGKYVCGSDNKFSCHWVWGLLWIKIALWTPDFLFFWAPKGWHRFLLERPFIHMQECEERNSRDKSSSQIENHSSDLLLLPSNHAEKLRFFLFFPFQ